jgi:starvation-inducible DNA-binding protein
MEFDNPPGNGKEGMRPVFEVRIALSRKACEESVAGLNHVLSDTMALRDLYKKQNWQASGETFSPIQLLFDKHLGEQEDLVDLIAERIHTLGGTASAKGTDVAGKTRVANPPQNGDEPVSRFESLVEAHERTLFATRAAARRASTLGDDGTIDLLVGDVIRTNEKQAWLLREHLK